MNVQHRRLPGVLPVLALAGLLSACSSSGTRAAASPAEPDFEHTSWENLSGLSFDELHSSFNGSGNESLVFGALSPVETGAGPYRQFLGRWEGYDYGPPVPRDIKVVLFIQQIAHGEGTAFLWAGTNLQRPRDVYRVHFRVSQAPEPVGYWRATWPEAWGDFSFRFDAASRQLKAQFEVHAPGYHGTSDVVLTRDRTFTVFRDYSAYLAGLRIHARRYDNPELERWGAGFLEYLPPGYDPAGSSEWPLVFFLCGTGDRGSDIEVLAKASPFLYIRQGHDLPAIIAAPVLATSSQYRSFPSPYLRGVLDELTSRYRVDHRRIAVTGLSMGGEATIRFAVTWPELVAAAAPLSFADIRFSEALRSEGFPVLDRPYAAAAGVPFYYVSGAEDPIIPAAAVHKTVAAMRDSGIDVTWKELAEHGHDTWTDTYSDPSFYDWLLSKSRP